MAAQLDLATSAAGIYLHVRATPVQPSSAVIIAHSPYLQARQHSSRKTHQQQLLLRVLLLLAGRRIIGSHGGLGCWWQRRCTVGRPAPQHCRQQHYKL
jgi:hypothetical protein